MSSCLKSSEHEHNVNVLYCQSSQSMSLMYMKRCNPAYILELQKLFFFMFQMPLSIVYTQCFAEYCIFKESRLKLWNIIFPTIYIFFKHHHNPLGTLYKYIFNKWYYAFFPMHILELNFCYMLVIYFFIYKILLTETGCVNFISHIACFFNISNNNTN